MILDNDDGGGRRGGEGKESKVNDDEEWQGIEKKERENLQKATAADFLKQSEARKSGRLGEQENIYVGQLDCSRRQYDRGNIWLGTAMRDAVNGKGITLGRLALALAHKFRCCCATEPLPSSTIHVTAAVHSLAHSLVRSSLLFTVTTSCASHHLCHLSILLQSTSE